MRDIAEDVRRVAFALMLHAYRSRDPDAVRQIEEAVRRGYDVMGWLPYVPAARAAIEAMPKPVSIDWAGMVGAAGE